MVLSISLGNPSVLHLVDGARQKENKLGASFSPWALSASLALCDKSSYA